ncbi:MAG: putative molybdenum carrier protein [Candidatus Ozemobacteraceae bacterium]
MLEASEFALCMLISGGQTGVDQAALDAGIALGIPVGGWCPAGRLSEAGPIPLHYPLTETTTRQYAARTRMNVRDSDMTLIFTWGPATGGTALTIRFATALFRPVLVLDLKKFSVKAAAKQLVQWLVERSPTILNVAGPRASEAPILRLLVGRILSTALARAVPPGIAPPWPPPRHSRIRTRTPPLPLS